MKRLLANVDDKIKLLTPVVICIIAMAIVAGYGWSTIQEVKIGSPQAEGVMECKDLTADVLPPPMYLVEMHLAAQEAAMKVTPESTEKFRNRYGTLKAEFQKRQEFWSKSLPESTLKSTVTGSLNTSAQDYFASVESSFIPALIAGDEKSAQLIVGGILAKRYASQRVVVDQVVALTDKDSEIKLASAEAMAGRNSILMLWIAVISSMIALGMSGIIVYRVTSRMRRLLEANDDYVAQVRAMDTVQATIEFHLDGTIANANENFLNTLGYTLDEIRGRHHSLFLEPEASAGTEYREFWAKLNRGEYVADVFKRIGKGGKVVWIQASYNPIFDSNGKVRKVVKFATDITAAKSLEQQVALNAERQARETNELRLKVDAINKSVQALANGDFTQSIPELGEDEVGLMAASLNGAIATVRSTLESVRDVAAQVADASAQLASATDEIASGAQQQASSLEETASTLEEITATVKQNSDSAQQARQLASGSRDIAEKGGHVVGTAVEAMSEINHSSKKIADIITAIDEIAFQTNLLALNAAVEAARAGEQGRGFAVVAAEVRNLAQRSATAAKEIKGLIHDSVQKVSAGTDLVNRSGATLTDIVTSVKRVTDIVTEIAAASREQATGIDQVNKAVTQMDSVTQRNASQTEELSATAQTLTSQANQLRDLVARFKLDSELPNPIGVKPKRTPSPVRVANHRPLAAKSHNGKNGRNGKHDLDRVGFGESDGFQDF